MKNKKFLLVALIFFLVLALVGGTLAYWNWESSEEQKTNVVVSIPNICSISVDGGGEVDSASVTVMPSTCTNTSNAIIKEIKINVDITETDSIIYLDLWLDINSIASELSASENFRYALTDSSTSCTDGAVFSGNFVGLSAGNKVRILRKEYSGSPPLSIEETYYLYIWLDAAETSLDVAGKSFELSLNGDCSNYEDTTIPTTTITATNYVATTQTAVLNISDNDEIQAYYFGTTDPNTSDVDWIIVNSSEDVSVTQTISSSGTYYLAAKDDMDNMSVVSATFYQTTFSISNGSVTPTKVITMYGNSFTLPTATADTDYTFDGWYTSSSYSGSALTTYTPTSNSTLYGKTTNTSLVSVDIPTAVNYCKSITYNGSTQTLTNDPGEGYTFSDNTGTDAGSYTVTATLEDGYMWSDQSTTTKSFSCEISKKTPTLSVSSSSLAITMTSTGTGSFTYTYDGDSNGFTCASTDTSVAICSVDVSSKKVTVTAKKAGNVTITLNVSAGTNYSAGSAPVSVAISMGTYTVNFYDNSDYIYNADTVLVKLSSRTYYKTTSEAALVGYVYGSSYTGPLLVGKTATSVSFYAPDHTSCANVTYAGTLTYNGETYYYSSGGCWWAGDITDASGLERTKYSVDASSTTAAAKLGAEQLLADNESTVSQTFTYGTAQTLTANTYTKTGHTFAGWSTSPVGEVEYTDAQSVSNLTTDSTINLYAIWTANTYTIGEDHYYMYQNTTSTHFADTDTTALYGTMYTPTSGTAPTGYNEATLFDYYYSYPGQDPSYEHIGTGTVGSTAFLVTQDMIVNILYYPKTYTINFYNNSNYISGADSVVAIINGRTFYKKYDAPALVGYVYDGWGTIGLLVGTTAESVAYYDTYDSSSTHTYGGTFTYNGVTYYYSNRTHLMEGDLTDTSGLDRNKYSTTGSNLTAIQTAAIQLLEDNSSSLSQSFIYDVAQALTANTYTKTGHTFAGWSTSPTGSVVYTDGQSVSNLTTESEIISLYAVWTANTYTISEDHYYMYQNTTSTHFADTDTTAVYGKMYTPTSSTSPPTGYQSTTTYRYYYSYPGQSPSYEYIGQGTVGSTAFLVTQAMIVNYYYYPITYTISYNACSGSGAPSSQTKYYATTLTLSTTTPTRAGYTFGGWSTDSSCTATSGTYSAGGSYTANASVTLYAIWEASGGTQLVENRTSISSLSDSLIAGMYRYQGSNSTVTDNYICFGTSDKSTCTSNTGTYMYRIVGVTESGEMRVIKYTPLSTSYAWASSNTTLTYWSTPCKLNTGLNGSYFLSNTTYVPSGWSDKIVASDWRFKKKAIAYSSTNIADAGETLYSSYETTVYNAKIGLTAVYEFYLAYSSTAVCNSSSSSCSSSWMELKNNSGTAENEWTLALRGDVASADSYQYGLSLYNGYFTASNAIVTYSFKVRPMFNISSSVSFLGGSGTISDPYLIS